MANILRFVILGDDRGGPAFASFTRQVERANKAVDRNNTALERQSGSLVVAEKRMSGMRVAIAGAAAAAPALIPVLGAATAAAAGLGAAIAGGGAAIGVFGAAAKYHLSKMQDALKKVQAANEAANKAGASKAVIENAKQLTRQFQQEYGVLATAQERLQGAWDKFTSQPVINTTLARGMNLLTAALPKLQPLFNVGAQAANRFLTVMQGFTQRGGLDKLVSILAGTGRMALGGFITILANLGRAVLALLPDMAAFSGSVVGGLVKMSAAFARWAAGPAQAAFPRFFAAVRQAAPQVLALLKSLAGVVPVLVRGMAPMAPVSLAVAAALARLVAAAPPQVITALAAGFIAWTAVMKGRELASGITGAVNGLKAFYGGAVSTVTWLGRLRDGFISSAAAESAFSGTAGTIGGKLRSAVGAVGAAVVAVKAWTVWSRVATVATWAWNLAMRALPFVAIATAVAALVYLVIKYHRQIWAFAVRAWHAIRDTITSVVSSVLGWLRGHWPLIVSILGGPVGAVAVLVIRHWNQIRTGAVTAFNTVIGFFRGIPGRILAALGKIGGLLYNKGKDVIQGFWNGLTAVWRSVTGWIGGIASWIKAHKGPVSLDASLLYPAGHALMSGFLGGLKAGFGPVGSFVGGIASWVLGKIKGAGGKLLGGKIVADTSGFAFPGVTSGALGGDARANKVLALSMFPWPSSMFGAFDYLEMREAGYNRFARNPSSGAYGIPQALPPTKMPFAAQAAGGSHAGAQLAWMFSYIRSVYGNPVNAANHERMFNWYASGTRRAARGWAWVGERGPELVRFRGGEQVGPVYAGSGAGGGGNTYQITVNVPPTASKADVGRTVVEAIRAYEKGSGTGWRK